MKHFLIALALLIGARASALGVATLTVQNDSNAKVWCAFAVWDQAGSKWTMYSWYGIANGAVGTYYNTAFFRCEKEGGGWWGTQTNFCVTRGTKHISPYHKADNYGQCQQYGGEWAGFNPLPNQATYTLYLNP
jgi:hypothetical protein